MPSVWQLASDWALDPTIAAGLALTAALYLAAARRARRWPAWRVGAFLAGLVTVAVALQSGLDTWSDRLLSVHMLQHLVLTLVAPPLLALGAPLVLALRATRGEPRQALERVLRSPVARALGNPAVGVVVFATVTLGTHLTPLYELAIGHPSVHALEHLLYLGAGLLFWTPLIGGEPGRRRLGSLARLVYPLLAMPSMAAVGAVLEAASRPLYSSYAAPARELGTSVLADQRLAGAIMWVGGTLALVPVALGAAWVALHAEERRALARESYADRLGATPP
jgi:putative membrane protein